MLLIVHNLPKDIRYIDVKQLIQDDCGLREAILDNLMNEAGGKRITVGLAEEEDAAILIRKLNGTLYKNRALYVEDVRQKKYGSKPQTSIPAGLQPPVPRPLIPYPVAPPTEMLGMNYNNMPFYMTKASNTIMNIDNSQDNQNNSNNQPFQQNTPSSYQAQNQWGYPRNILYPNKIQDSPLINVPQTYDSYQDNRDVSDRRDRRDNQTNWRDNKSPPSKRHENFGNKSQRQSRSDGTKYSRHEDDRRPRDRVRDRSLDDRNDFEFSRRSRSRRSNRDRDSYHERQSDREQNAYDHNDRQERDRREREFDRNKRFNKPSPEQNLNIWSERPNATSTIFSSNPENSTFSKSNMNIFGTTTTFGFGGQTSNNRMAFNQPNQIVLPQGNFPPAKKPRIDQNVYTNQIVNKPVSQFKAVNSEADFQKMMRRVANWRNQSATLLAKQIIKNASTSKLDNYIFKAVLKKLRDCILLRLDVILGSNIPSSLDEILNSYRMKFDERNDIPFFKGVMEKVEREIGENSEGSAATYYSSNNTNKEQPRDPRLFRTENVPKTKPTDNSQPTRAQQNTLPTQSQGPTGKNTPKDIFMPKLKGHSVEKRQLRKLKKNGILEYQEDFYKMDPTLQNAVDDEIEQLVQCYLTACEPSNNEDEETVRKRILTNSVSEFKKMIKLHVTKRVLNITQGLCVRIFPTYKHPKREVLSAFLQRHGVTNFKKSDNSKMYIAECDSYESYDKLLAIQTATFGDNIGIQIKPMYITGPPEKNAKDTDRDQNEGDFSKDVDKVDLKLSELDESLENVDDPDLVIVENKRNDVVVIHDESFNLGDISFKIDDDKHLPAISNVSDRVDTNVTESIVNEKSNDENSNNEQLIPANDIENVNINSNNEDKANNQTQMKESHVIPDDNENRILQETKDSTISSDNNDNPQNIQDVTNDSEDKDDRHDKEIKDSTLPDNNDNSENIVENVTKDSENKDNENDKEIKDSSQNPNNSDLLVDKQNDEQITKDTESVDDIFNSVDDIDEDDLEDF